TADGFIAPETRAEREPVWITNSYSKQLVHKWRAEEQGILIGTNTAVEDDPKLTTRLWTGANPTRIILDQHLRIPKNSALYTGKVKTIFLCGKLPILSTEEEQKEIKNISFEQIDFTENVGEQV